MNCCRSSGFSVSSVVRTCLRLPSNSSFPICAETSSAMTHKLERNHPANRAASWLSVSLGVSTPTQPSCVSQQRSQWLQLERRHQRKKFCLRACARAAIHAATAESPAPTAMNFEQVRWQTSLVSRDLRHRPVLDFAPLCAGRFTRGVRRRSYKIVIVATILGGHDLTQRCARSFAPALGRDNGTSVLWPTIVRGLRTISLPASRKVSSSGPFRRRVARLNSLGAR